MTQDEMKTCELICKINEQAGAKSPLEWSDEITMMVAKHFLGRKAPKNLDLVREKFDSLMASLAGKAMLSQV